ncbi:hypothetical protein [Niveispirillum sp.]|uniref:hypothetical protein n=1 Tax=Niveispirillum sp. TaxID=1917217 RepID=UPI001B46F508|nr:hypothetical protein [Niveispirillum sp.]MBP7335594.1 hypothetical protein [Niveispirillum sp.]
MKQADAIVELAGLVRGARPPSLDNAETEAVLRIAMALLLELSVTNDRVDRLERELAALRGVPVESLKSAPLAPAAVADRQAATDGLMARVLSGMVRKDAAGNV